MPEERRGVRRGRAAVLSRRELSVILLVFGVVISIYMVLLSGSTTAQTGGTTSQDDGCSNPEIVETFSGTENRRTPQFEITGDTFRLDFEVTEIDPDEFTSFSIDVLDEDGLFVDGTTPFSDDVSDTINILDGPGIFSLEINAENVEYDITVEDCVGAQPTTPRREDSIINIPNRLPPRTGGLPVYGVVAGFVLAGVGLLVVGLEARRGRRG